MPTVASAVAPTDPAARLGRWLQRLPHAQRKNALGLLADARVRPRRRDLAKTTLPDDYR